MTSDRLLELSTLAAYLALLLWIGLRPARRIKPSDDHTLAGRGVGWVIVLATTPVTMVGAVRRSAWWRRCLKSASLRHW